jgi:hypothetical protein
MGAQEDQLLQDLNKLATKLVNLQAWIQASSILYSIPVKNPNDILKDSGAIIDKIGNYFLSIQERDKKEAEVLNQKTEKQEQTNTS